MARRRKRGSRRGYKKHRRAGKKKLALAPLLPLVQPTFNAFSNVSQGMLLKDVAGNLMFDTFGLIKGTGRIDMIKLGQQATLGIVGIIIHMAAAPINRRMPKWLPVRV